METAELPTIPPQKPTKFTPMVAGTDRAKQIARLGVEKRLANQAQAKEAKLNLCATTQDPFISQQLTRTRTRIVEMDTLLGTLSADPDAGFKVGCTLKKLWEIYQLLAGMPGPGTRKPIAERPKRASQSSEPIED